MFALNGVVYAPRAVIYMPCVHNPRVHGRFYVLEGYALYGKRAMEDARLNDEENVYRFEVHREEHWVHTIGRKVAGVILGLN